MKSRLTRLPLHWSLSPGLLLACLLSTATAADPPVAADQDDERPVAQVSPAEMYKPTAIPDRIILTWSDDPRTTQSVTWRTSTEVARGIAEIAEAQPHPYFSERSDRVPAETTLLETDLSSAHFHSVTFRQLQPGLVYSYRVGDGSNWSEWFQFRTAPAEPAPFSFIYFGDAQNNLRSLWSRVVREAYRDAPKAAFTLHAGDLINRAEADAEWAEWHGAGAWLNAMIPTVALPGNHEYSLVQGAGYRLSHHWRPSFTLPENGPVGLEETCYTLTYQNLRLICLNSNLRLEDQAVWLEEVLANNQSPWVICSFHHPVFSTGRNRDNPRLRTLWKPLFDKYRVDLILQGHDHAYGRTGLTVPADPRAGDEVVLSAQAQGSTHSEPPSAGAHVESNVATGVQAIEQTVGTVYVVSVSGPKMYNNSRHWFMRRLAEDTQLYQVIEIDGRRLKYEARTATGRLYDSFELLKRPGSVNQLIEHPAEVAEHLRPDK